MKEVITAYWNEGRNSFIEQRGELIRCKDCKYARRDYVTGAMFCTKLTEKYTTQDDKSVSEYWYCADGKRG